MSPLRMVPFAARNLVRHPRRTLVSGLAVAAGITAVLCAAGISRAFLDYMLERVVAGKIGALQVHRKGYVAAAQSASLDRRLGLELGERLLRVPGVKAAAPRLVFSGLVSSARGQTAFVARGVDLSSEPSVCPRLWADLTSGSLSGAGSAVLGAGLVKGLRVRSGESVMLTATSPGGRVNAVAVKVTGTQGEVVALENRNVLTVPLALAQELTGLDGEVTEWALAVDASADVAVVAAAVRSELGEEFEVHTWAELVPYLSDGLVYMRWFIAFLGALLALVVAAGITNALMMGVYEREREIGTQLAVGMRARDVRMLFLVEAALLGLGAAVLGVAVGSGVVTVLGAVGMPASSMGAVGADLLHPAVDGAVAFSAAVGAVLTAVVAGVLPAWRASRLKPVDALAGR